MSNRLLRNTVYGSVAGCAMTLSNFISGLIVARQLGAHLTGDVTFMIWIASTASVLVMLGIPFTMSRFLLDLEPRAGLAAALAFAKSLVLRFLLLASLPCVVAFALALLSESSRSHLRQISGALSDRGDLVLIGVFCLLQSLAEFSRALSRGTHRFDELAKVSVISGIIQCLAVFLGVWCFGVGGALVAYSLGCVVFLLLLRPLAHIKAQREACELTSFTRYTAYRWGSEVLALFVWARIEIIFLQYYCGATSVAFFSVALTLTSLAVQGPMMLTWGLMPYFAERNAVADHEGTQAVFTAATRLLAMLVLPCCFGTAAIAHLLLPFLFGADFTGAEHVVAILVVASAFPAVGAAVCSVLLAKGRSDIDFYSCLGGAIVSVLLGLVLTKWFGLMGAAWSRVVVQIAVASCGFLFVHYRLRLRLPLKALGKLVISAVCCALVASAVSRTGQSLAIVILAIAAGASTYALCLHLFSVLEAEEIRFLKRLFLSVMQPLKPPQIERSAGRPEHG